MKTINLKTIEKYLFYIFLASIPFQTRVFLWSAGIVEGFNEWQSVFLYGTDLIVIALFSLIVFNKKILSASFFAKKSFKVAYPSFAYGFLALFLFFVIVSIFFAPYKLVAIYRFVKLLEFVFVFWYVVHSLPRISFSGIALAFSFGGFIQSFIAIGQFILQRSLGLKILGEPFLEAGRQEVAEFVAFGSRFMRSYGTFPSPNVLGAYLVLALLFLVTWYILQPKLKPGQTVFAGLGAVLLSLGLFLSFSRTAILGAVVAFFVYIIFLMHKKTSLEYKKRALYIFTPLVFTALVVGVLFWPEIYSRIFTTFDYGDLALRERTFFNELSYDVMQDYPEGVGIGNYTLTLRQDNFGLRDSLYQPVHNLFLLISSETSILGAVAFLGFIASLLWLLFKKLKKDSSVINIFAVCSLLFITITALLDHYYWTLQQGGLMFWLVLGLVYSVLYKKHIPT